jgi:transcriptional regulator with XRE-family HTH domain
MLPAGARELEYYLEALSRADICRLCGVHRTTLSRWLDGSSAVPVSVLNLLRIVSTGRLPTMGKEWDGWTFQGSDLYTPANFPVSPGEILAMPYRKALLRDQQKQIAHLRVTVEKLTQELAAIDHAANDALQWPFSPPEGNPKRAINDDSTASQSAGALGRQILRPYRL